MTEFATNHMTNVIEGYGLTEYEMNSALAKSKQTPYEALWEGAKRSELSGTQMEYMFPAIIDTTNLWRLSRTIDQKSKL